MRRTLQFFLLIAFGASMASAALAQITMQATPAPTATAENESWYVTNEPVVFAGNNYYPAGPSIHFMPNEMVLSGFFRGVPLYTRTTIEPYSIVFVPLAGGLVRPFERRRAGDLVGTTGSSMPSLRVEIPSAFSRPSPIQAAGPPFVETPGIITGFPSPQAMQGVTAPTSASAPSGVPTAGVLTAPRGKRVGRPPANGVYVEFNNQRWYSRSTKSLDAATLRQVGEWHGFPVYTSASTGPSTIYIPVARGSDAYAAYVRR
jgi:hypothetical protein